MSVAAATDCSGRRQPFVDETIVVWRAVLFLIAAYVALAAAGQAVFVTKTLVLPLVVTYGVLQRDRHIFLRDWVPYIGATLLFDAVRGLIFALVEEGWRPVYYAYVIALELNLTGTFALGLPLQWNWRSPFLDQLFVAWHGTHFLVFLLFGLIVWHYRRADFWRYRATCLGVMYVGLLGYFLVPTVPPWLAAQQGMLPKLAAVSHEVYARGIPPVFLAALDTNPVAAMPSLHTAFPAACTVLAWYLFGSWAGITFSLYTIIQAIGIIYLGEHYLVDVLAGGALAIFVSWEVNRHVHPRVLSVRRAMVYGGLLIVGTGATYAVTVLMRPSV
jgi:hypothetical protein